MSKTILITGAGTGFGRGVSMELASRGHTVIAGTYDDAQEADLASTAAKAGVELDIIKLDITNEQHRQRAFAREIDILVNNAGTIETGPMAEIPETRVRKSFEVNVFGTLAMIQGFAPQMVKRGKGKIVTVSSMVGLFSVPFAAAYCATKHALEAMIGGLRAELTGTGVEVCMINPGPFATGFNEDGAASMDSWFDPDKTLSLPELVEARKGLLDGQFNPQLQIDDMVRVIEEEGSMFRNLCPREIEPWIRAMQERAWVAKDEEALFIDPSELG
jgi:short-subunit dehydrogenase